MRRLLLVLIAGLFLLSARTSCAPTLTPTPSRPASTPTPEEKPRDVIVEPMPKKIESVSSLELKISEASPTQLVFALDYFDPEGQRVRFSDASDLIAVIEITGITTDRGTKHVLSSRDMKAPIIHSSDDLIIVPAELANFSDVDTENLTLRVHVKGDNPPIHVFAEHTFSWAVKATPSSAPEPAPEPTPTPTPRDPLQYRELDSFTTEAVKDVRRHADMRGYDLPDEIVVSPDFARYVVIQNLDGVPGTFEVRYTLTTADKEAAERQMWLIQRTPEEYAELKREYYEGSIKLYLEPGEIGIAICPPGGICIAPDRVPFDHELEITPDTKSTTVR